MTRPPAAGLREALGRILWVIGFPARLTLIGAIRVYQLTLGAIVGGQCRFHPSCSVYAEGAIRARGAVIGVGLTVWRVLRCSPLSRGGLDPPPAGRARAVSALYDGVILHNQKAGP